MPPISNRLISFPSDSGSDERADAEVLWEACVRWAHQPRDGLRLPMEIAAEIARAVMEAALRELPGDTAPIAVSAFCQRRARAFAVERVARERAQQGDMHLWHDAAWHPDEPLLDLRELQTDGHAGWLAAVPVLRELALPVIRGCGVPAEDAEDVLAETLAALIQPDARAQRPLDALLVAEQLPALCKVIARRRSADFLRRCFAEKRAVNLEVAIDSMEHGGVATAMATVAPEFDLHDILEQSAHAVSPAQWELITRLIIHPSDTHTSLIADARLMSALFIDPQSSEATRRRRLHETLDLALKLIRQHLDLP